jgi:hypothetical protein
VSTVPRNDKYTEGNDNTEYFSDAVKEKIVVETDYEQTGENDKPAKN